MNPELQRALPGNGYASTLSRRTSKACANCRRDKIRCDGVRPCGNCSRRGFHEGCIDGCDPCRRARVRCEEGKPCQRCRFMHIDCTEEPPANSFEQESTAPSLKGSRIMERAKLACMACRRDNKKCDDQRPCSRCISRSEECIHVARGPKLVKLRCEGCRRDNKRCEDSRPCKFCAESSQPCVTLPRKGRGHGTRVKAACISCRRDKVRCDGVRPCSACTRKGCDCIERACTACSRDGRASECTHRRQSDTAPAVVQQPDEPAVELCSVSYGYELLNMSDLNHSRLSTSDMRSTDVAGIYQQPIPISDSSLASFCYPQQYFPPSSAMSHAVHANNNYYHASTNGVNHHLASSSMSSIF